MNNAIRIALVGVLAAACGGGVTGKKEMSKLAADAPPPPSGGGSGKIDRSVSADAKKDFAAAVAFYKEQGKGGWNKSSCQAAAAKFEQVASAHDKMVEAIYNAGLSFQNCGMMKDAEAKYQDALKIHPGHGPSLSNLGQIYFLGGNEARAKQYWEKAVEADKKVVGARNNLAWLMIRQVREKKARLGDVEEQALTHLRSALAVENDNIEAYVLLSLLYMEGAEKNKARLTLAKLLLDEAKKRNDKYAPLHNAYGLLELKRENVAQALDEFRQAVQLNPDFIEARMNVGNIVLGFRKYDEAAEQFNAVLKMKPKYYDAVLGLGVAQRGLKQLDEAEKSYNRAAGIDSSRAEAYFNLGVLYKDFRANATENLKAAQEAYRTAIRYFNQARGKSNADQQLQSDAKDNISDCEKNIKSLDEAQKFQQQAPPAPPPAAPAPAPAAGGKK
jgi:tetratricopeptide (TPR) repeat protein